MKAKKAKPGDLVMVYWSDICQSAHLGTGEAGILIRRTAMFYVGDKWQREGGKRHKVRVFCPTIDGPDVIDSGGYLAIPAPNVLCLRVVEERDAHENAYKTWTSSGGSGSDKSAR